MLDFLLALLLALEMAPAADRSQPNVLFIISDDLTATALSCYGNKICHTPNMVIAWRHKEPDLPEPIARGRTAGPHEPRSCRATIRTRRAFSATPARARRSASGPRGRSISKTPAITRPASARFITWEFPAASKKGATVANTTVAMVPTTQLRGPRGSTARDRSGKRRALAKRWKAIRVAKSPWWEATHL